MYQGLPQTVSPTHVCVASDADYGLASNSLINDGFSSVVVGAPFLVSTDPNRHTWTSSISIFTYGFGECG